MDEVNHTEIDLKELTDIKIQFLIEWRKIKESSINECDTLSKIVILKKCLKGNGKTRLGLKGMILADDVDITNLTHLFYASVKASRVVCGENIGYHNPRKCLLSKSVYSPNSSYLRMI